MDKDRKPTSQELIDLDRRAAIDEAVGDLASISRLIAQELSRDVWNRPDRDIDTLKFLSKKLSEQTDELEVCTTLQAL